MMTADYIIDFNLIPCKFQAFSLLCCGENIQLAMQHVEVTPHSNPVNIKNILIFQEFPQN